MKVLCACEESQAVCAEFRKIGHEAYSCDLQPCSGGRPDWHIQGDVLPLLSQDWDLVVAFPPCTHLAVSGARHFAAKRKDGRQQGGVDFFMQFSRLECPYAIENPVGIMSTIFRKPDQIIQPWQFGHGETKATCLWLHCLPLLTSTDIVAGRDQRIWKMAPSPERAKMRSQTYPGIAAAMATQWSVSLMREIPPETGVGSREPVGKGQEGPEAGKGQEGPAWEIFVRWVRRNVLTSRKKRID